MATEETKFTPGKTTFYQGDNQTHPSSASNPASLAKAPANKLPN